MPHSTEKQPGITDSSLQHELPLEGYAKAMVNLDDVARFDTDPKTVGMKAKMLESGEISAHLVQAYEVLAISKSVAARFKQHRYCQNANGAVTLAVSNLFKLQKWLDRKADRTMASDDGEYRTMLRNTFAWPYGATGDARNDLCPIIAYLQLIVQRTPIEEWAQAVADVGVRDSSTSPLAFAWVMALSRPELGEQTARVAVLISMGLHVYHKIVLIPVKAKAEKAMANMMYENEVFDRGTIPALAYMAKESFLWAVTQLQASDTTQTQDNRDYEELVDSLRPISKALSNAGDQYARYLRTGSTSRERRDLVRSIGVWTDVIVSKAQILVPDNVVLVIPNVSQADL